MLKTHKVFRQWLQLCAILTALAGVVIYTLTWQHKVIETRELDRLNSLAKVIDVNLAHQLNSTNETLAVIRNDVPLWKARKEERALINKRLRAMDDAMPGVRTILIVNADGIAVASDRAELIGKNFSERDYFKVPQRHPDPEMLYISPPFKTVMGIWTMTLTRAIFSRTGEFDGIVTAALDPNYFNTLLLSVLYASDMRVVLYHNDGTIFLSEPDRKDIEGSDVAKSGTFFSRHLQSKQTANLFIGHTYLTKEERMVAFRTITSKKSIVDKHLIISISRDQSAVLATWRHMVIGATATFGVLALSTILGLFFYQRRERDIELLEGAYLSKLQESEKRYRELVEWTHNLVTNVDAEGHITYLNTIGERIFGKKKDEVIGLPVFQFIHPDDQARTKEWFDDCIRRRIVQASIENRQVNSSTGEVFDMLWACNFVFDEAGRLLSVNGFAHDITERKRAEDQLHKSEQRFRELADSLPQTVFETDLDGRLTYVNRTALTMFGYTPEEVAKGVTVIDVIAPQDRERAGRNMLDRMRGERAGHQEYTALRKDGSTFPATVHSTPIVRDGRPVGLRGILIDLTDRKLFEAELVKMEKLESIGILAGGIAHDFNNILTGIFGNLSLAKTRLSPADQIYKWIDETEKASFHARDLTQQLLTFAKGGSPVRKVVPLEPLIRNSSTFAARGANVKVDINFTEKLRPVEVDEGQIGQVISNLVINACQAMANGGTVSVIASNCTIAADQAPPLPAGDYVCVQVRDQGIGIPAEHLPNIFDPYFTTKQQGSGLGLAVAYSVVKNHGGHIEVTSTLGTGTTFTVYLPASEKDVAAPPRAAGSVVTGRGRVLIMDDEEIVRSVVGSMLTELGYEVAYSKDGSEAVRLYREAMAGNSGFDVVIMDLTVPGGMGGRDAVRELAAIDPQVKAIVSSGYSNDPIMSDFRSYGFVDVVKKPFHFQELSETLYRVLRGPGRSS